MSFSVYEKFSLIWRSAGPHNFVFISLNLLCSAANAFSGRSCLYRHFSDRPCLAMSYYSRLRQNVECTKNTPQASPEDPENTCGRRGVLYLMSDCLIYESFFIIQSISFVVFIFSRTSSSSRQSAILPSRSRCSSPIPAIPKTS